MALEVNRLSSYATLASAVSAMGDRVTELIIDKADSLLADVTIPANIHCVFVAGGIITTTGWTLTFSAEPEIGRTQAFAGTGTIVGLDYAYPEWWGAVGDADIATYTGTDDTAAIEAAINSLANGGELIASRLYAVEGHDCGDFPFRYGINLPASIANVTVRGLDNQTCGFIWTHPTKLGHIFRTEGYDAGDGKWCNGWRFTNLYLAADPDAGMDWGSTTSAAFGIHKFHNLKIDNCRMYGFTCAIVRCAMSPSDLSTDFDYHDNEYYGQGIICGTGICLNNLDGFRICNNIFDGCSRPTFFELSDSPVGEVVCNGIIQGNIYRGGGVATYDNTSHGGDSSNAWCAIGALPNEGNYVRDIVASNNLIYDNAGEDSQNPPGAFIFIGNASTPGSIANITITNNKTYNYTPSTVLSTDIHCFFQHCDRIVFIANTIEEPIASLHSAAYAVAVYDTKNSIFAMNNIQGDNWTSGIVENTTIGELNNLFYCNNYSHMYTILNNGTTSKSIKFDINGDSGRLDINVGLFDTSWWKNGYAYFNYSGASKAIITPYGLNCPATLMMDPLAAEPTGKTQGMICLANRANWDPLSKGSGGAYLVWYNGSAWKALDEQ